jgi:hypothetical protein
MINQANFSVIDAITTQKAYVAFPTTQSVVQKQ